MSKHGLIVAGLSLIGALCFSDVANAAGGCGRGWHRGPHGGCRRNVEVVPVRPLIAPARPVVVEPVRPVVVAPGAEVIIAPMGRPCPRGYHLGPQGRRCWRN